MKCGERKSTLYITYRYDPSDKVKSPKLSCQNLDAAFVSMRGCQVGESATSIELCRSWAAQLA